MVESANKLKLEAAEIDKELNYIGALRNNHQGPRGQTQKQSDQASSES